MAEWPPAPIHQLSETGAYMVTAGTYCKEHFFCSRERLDVLQSTLFSVADAYAWRLQAWSIFSNHYHFVAVSPDEAATLPALIRRLHSATAQAVNALDGTPGRRV